MSTGTIKTSAECLEPFLAHPTLIQPKLQSSNTQIAPVSASALHDLLEQAHRLGRVPEFEHGGGEVVRGRERVRVFEPEQAPATGQRLAQDPCHRER